MRADGHSLFQRGFFRTFNVSHRQGHEMLKEFASSRRLHNDSDKMETRGRKLIISSQKIREMERILEEKGIEARGLTWA